MNQILHTEFLVLTYRNKTEVKGDHQHEKQQSRQQAHIITAATTTTAWPHRHSRRYLTLAEKPKRECFKLRSSEIGARNLPALKMSGVLAPVVNKTCNGDGNVPSSKGKEELQLTFVFIQALKGLRNSRWLPQAKWPSHPKSLGWFWILQIRKSKFLTHVRAIYFLLNFHAALLSSKSCVTMRTGDNLLCLWFTR